MNKDIKDFATKVSEFLSGGSQPEWFNPQVGLCSNLTGYMVKLDMTYYKRLDTRISLNRELERWGEFEHMHYPFNRTACDYHREMECDLVYENKARLACIEGIANGE